MNSSPWKEIAHILKFKILGNVVSIYKIISIASSYFFPRWDFQEVFPTKQVPDWKNKMILIMTLILNLLVTLSL